MKTKSSIFILFSSLFLLFILFSSLLLTRPIPISQSSYSFSIPEEDVDVYLNADGTLSIMYKIVISNDFEGKPIDHIVINIPNHNYNKGDIIAGISNLAGSRPIEVGDIQPTDATNISIILNFHSNNWYYSDYIIYAGRESTVDVYIPKVNHVLYSDSDDANYASAVFSPTLFDASMVHGNTHMTVTLHLPPGVTADEGRYHPPSANWIGTGGPETGFDINNCFFYRWSSYDANAYTKYTFGVLFPLRAVPRDAIFYNKFLDQISYQVGSILRQRDTLIIITGALLIIVTILMTILLLR